MNRNEYYSIWKPLPQNEGLKDPDNFFESADAHLDQTR